MKKLLVLASLLLVLGTSSLSAQSAGGGDPNAVQCVCDLSTGDQSSGCYSTKNGLGNNPWSMSLVVDILRPARSAFGLSLGQMIQRYHDCGCVVTYLGGNVFRVQIGGIGSIEVVVDGL